MSSGHHHKRRSPSPTDKRDTEDDRSTPEVKADDLDEKGRESPSDEQETRNDQSPREDKTYQREKRESDDEEEQTRDPVDFDSRSFVSRVQELHAKLQADSLKYVDEDFPANELTTMVHSVTSTMADFKEYAMHTQKEMEKVRELMKDIKDRVYKRIQAKGYDPKSAQERKGLEERELEAKVAQLNKEVAKAAEELVRASQVYVETEQAAVQATLVAEQAAAEAQRIQAEYEARKKADMESRRAEEKKREAEKIHREEQEKRKEELRLEEEARLIKLRKPEEKIAPVWEKWPVFTYNVQGAEFSQGIGCMIRGDPDVFKENMIKIQTVDPLQKKHILDENEELVSDVIQLSPAHDDDKLVGSVIVAIPHCTSRASAISREPVLKAEMKDGKWEEIKSHEVTFESNKDIKFVQAEVTIFTTICVVTRFKKDYLVMTKKGGKVTSNVDTRVTFTANKGTFKRPENFVLMLQPVDSATIARVRERSAAASKLLTSSSVVNMSWASDTFPEPITMTLPCPPNPVKAKKAAAVREAKEAKMKNPQHATVMAAAIVANEPKRVEKKGKMAKSKNTNEDDDEIDRPKTSVTRWYMGQYGSNEDDENDILYFLRKMANNKWAVVENMHIAQIKLDLLQLHFTEAIPTFMVLRTRTNADVKDAQMLAETIETCLRERVVGIVLRQKRDNPCDVVLSVVPTNRIDKMIAQLDEDNYEASVTNNTQKEATIKYLNEGDILQVGFTGNVKSYDNTTKLDFCFNSQKASEMKFTITEVDKYLQKGYGEFRGFVQLEKIYEIVHMPPKNAKKEEGQPDPVPKIEVKREVISKHMVKIPKEDESSPKTLRKAPICIRNNDNSLDDDTVRHVAQSLGDEWTKVAHYLNVRRQRIQAIMRNNMNADDEDIKYEMLVTWLKKVPHSANKTELLIGALLYGNRHDLVQELREQEEEYQERRRRGEGSRMSRTPSHGNNRNRPSSGHKHNLSRPQSGASVHSRRSVRSGSVGSEKD